MRASLATKPPAMELAAMLTGGQIRAARALLNWSGRELAERCGVSWATIQRAEGVDDTPNMQVKNLMAIKATLEAGGVVFMDRAETRDGGPGVRLR